MDVNKMLDNLLGEPQEEQIPSVQTANEIAADSIFQAKHTVKRHCEDCGKLFDATGSSKYCPDCRNERRMAGMRARKIECESCGKVFHPSNGAVKLCDTCREDKDRVRAWKEKQGVTVIQAAKENGAEVATEHTHFPALAEERRRKRQPVNVNLDNFIPKKVADMDTALNRPVNIPEKEAPVALPDEEAKKQDIQKELLRTARALARLAKASGVAVSTYIDAVMHFADGFAALDAVTVNGGKQDG